MALKLVMLPGSLIWMGTGVWLLRNGDPVAGGLAIVCGVAAAAAVLRA